MLDFWGGHNVICSVSYVCWVECEKTNCEHLNSTEKKPGGKQWPTCSVKPFCKITYIILLKRTCLDRFMSYTKYWSSPPNLWMRFLNILGSIQMAIQRYTPVYIEVSCTYSTWPWIWTRKKSKIHDPLRCDVHKALVSNLGFFNEIFKNEHVKSKNPPVMKIDTPLKTNMSPENQWLEDVFPTKIVPF